MGYARNRVVPAARVRWERMLLRPRLAPLIWKWIKGAATIVFGLLAFVEVLASLSYFGSLVR